MDIATLINTHADPLMTADTANSVKVWMTSKILVIVDGAGWHHFGSRFDYPLHKGLVHGRPKSPYRNMLVGIAELCKLYPDVQWYCYLESDCLIANDRFKSDLVNQRNKYIGGFEYRGGGGMNVPILNQVVGGQVKENHHLLGAVMFMSRKFVHKMVENNLPAKLLKATEGFNSGDVPDFHGYAFEEELFPSLANYYYPGSVFQIGEWAKYNVRWQPDISSQEITPGVSIIHPLKSFDHPIRLHYRRFRERIKK